MHPPLFARYFILGSIYLNICFITLIAVFIAGSMSWPISVIQVVMDDSKSTKNTQIKERKGVLLKLYLRLFIKEDLLKQVPIRLKILEDMAHGKKAGLWENKN